MEESQGSNGRYTGLQRDIQYLTKVQDELKVQVSKGFDDLRSTLTKRLDEQDAAITCNTKAITENAKKIIVVEERQRTMTGLLGVFQAFGIAFATALGRLGQG